MMNGKIRGKQSSQVLKKRELRSQLQRLAEQCRVVMETLHDAVYIMDTTGRVTCVNAALEHLTGYQRGELLGHSAALFCEPNHVPMFARRRQRALRGESVPMRLDTEIIRKDGRRISAELSVANLMLEGRMVGRIGIIRDVTERRQLEAQLSQVQQTEAVGRLAGGIAHDFNNLLQVILGYGELLLHRLGSGHPLEQHAQEIVKAAERAAALTQQLLAFGRRQALQLRSVDLNAIIIDMELMLHRLLGADITLVTKLTPSLGYIEADSGKFEQVVLNLVVNARDAMPQGGQLIIETANLEVSDAEMSHSLDRPPGRYVRLVVQDTGCGMDAATQARLFEPFFTTKAPGQGTGLGLATVYGTVTQRGGYITVHSTPGHGTTFIIDLPRIEGAMQDIDMPDTPDGVPGGQETILVVEDEVIIRSLLCEALQLAGYTVLEARHGQEAIHIGEQHRGPIDLLITDVVMPSIRGPEVAQRLASRYPTMKVLLVSGYAPDAIPHQGRLDPAVPFLQKPFTPAELARKVRDTLDAPTA